MSWAAEIPHRSALPDAAHDGFDVIPLRRVLRKRLKDGCVSGAVLKVKQQGVVGCGRCRRRDGHVAHVVGSCMCRLGRHDRRSEDHFSYAVCHSTAALLVSREEMEVLKEVVSKSTLTTITDEVGRQVVVSRVENRTEHTPWWFCFHRGRFLARRFATQRCNNLMDHRRSPVGGMFDTVCVMRDLGYGMCDMRFGIWDV
jgi:hypothetical protein